ncbi:DUF5811 family protein [Halococcoides cellulosivorans]|uniref:Uncharacterized protein n=1 Tax=Halococcoides cellulosivorans TaxID=1679096 RepID=A0A2R4WYM0_9EURY|nr:DUF5811 family protein [Halococcoides cellulosivorans]AWB26631.1 hypothetical protein HARCEL1_02345 [Halococcoides cellulosivorans]
MYGNVSFEDDDDVTLSPAERDRLRREIESVAAATRDLLPGEFVVGSELTDGSDGPLATVAVQPPVGAPISGGYNPEDGIEIDAEKRQEFARGLAASAALQVKRSMGEVTAPPAQ